MPVEVERFGVIEGERFTPSIPPTKSRRQAEIDRLEEEQLKAQWRKRRRRRV